MTEKILKGGIIALLLFIISYGGYRLMKPSTPSTPDPSTLPYFEMKETGSEEVFESKSLDNGRETILFYYGPECSHCRTLADEVRSRMDMLKEVNLVYVTHIDPYKAEQFRKLYGFDKFSNVHFLHNDGSTFYNAFGDMFIPSAYVYGKDGKLKRFIRGETSIRELLPLIENLKEPGA